MNRKLLLFGVLSVFLFAIPAMATTVCPVSDPFDLEVEAHLQVSIWDDGRVEFWTQTPDVSLTPVAPEGYDINFVGPVNMDYAQVKALDRYSLERAPWNGVNVTGAWEEVPGNEICVENTINFQTRVNELTNWLWRASAQDYVNAVSCDEGAVTADISITFLESPDPAFDEVFTILVPGDPVENNICGFEVFLKVDCASSSDYGVWYFEDPNWVPLDVELFSDGDNCYITFFDDNFDRVYGFGEKPESTVISGDIADEGCAVWTLTLTPAVGENDGVSGLLREVENPSDDGNDEFYVELVLSGDIEAANLCVDFSACELDEGVVVDGFFLWDGTNWQPILEITGTGFCVDVPVSLVGPNSFWGIGDSSLFAAPGDDEDDDGHGGGGGCNVGGFSAGLLLLALPLFTLFRK